MPSFIDTILVFDFHSALVKTSSIILVIIILYWLVFFEPRIMEQSIQ